MTDSSGKKMKNYSYSYIRVLSCIAIIVLHTANVSEILYKDSISMQQVGVSLGTVYNMMWAVPCFLMVSGALLLNPDRKITFKKVYDTYIPKALEPLIVLGVVFQIFDDIMDGRGITGDTWIDAIQDVFTGHSWAHLWYLYMLLGIYILLPIYRIITENCSDYLMKYLLIAYFVFQSVLPVAKVFDLPCAFTLQVSGIYICYFFLGYAISKGILRFSRIMALMLVLVGTIGIIISTFFRYGYSVEEMDIILTSYASPFVVFQAIGIFSLIFNKTENDFEKPAVREKILKFFDENSFGVYLLHMFLFALF